MATTSFTILRRITGFAFALMLVSFCLTGAAAGQGTPLVTASSAAGLSHSTGWGMIQQTAIDSKGDWLVVESAGFNDQAWLDAFGHVHSDALRVTERFHRRDFGHMEMEVRLDDPKTFTKPVSVRFNLALIPDTELLETFCPESEKDLAHLPAK